MKQQPAKNGAPSPNPLQIPEDATIHERLRALLLYFVDLMKNSFLEKAHEIENEQPEWATELYAGAELYEKQSKQAIELIQQGEFTLEALKKVTGTLYVTNLTLRWTLEQQTTTFRKLMQNPSPVVAEQIEQAQNEVELGREEGFNRLLELVSANRSNYPLLMIMGFIYLKKKKNITFAMRYFEKAAQTPTIHDPAHYRNLALSFLANCHEGKKQFKNSLNTLLHAERGGAPDSPVLFDIARYYALTGNARKAADYFDQAVRTRPEFIALALTEPSFEPIREPIDQQILHHYDTFKNLCNAFIPLLQPLLDVVDQFELERYSKELKRTMRVTRFNMAMIRKGFYSGYRMGIVGFFRGAFPEVLYAIKKALQAHARNGRKQIRNQNEELKKRVRTMKATVAPLVGLITGYGGFSSTDSVANLLPLSIPYFEWILAGVSAATGGVIALAFLGSYLKRNLRDEQTFVNRLKEEAAKLSPLEEQLRSFWIERVQPMIDEKVFMDEDEVEL